MVKKRGRQAIHAMQEDAPSASGTTGMETELSKARLGVKKMELKQKPAKRGQRTAKQQQRKQMKLDKALGFADRKSSKALKLTNANHKKQHAKSLWSDSKE